MRQNFELWRGFEGVDFEQMTHDQVDQLIDEAWPGVMADVDKCLAHGTNYPFSRMGFKQLYMVRTMKETDEIDVTSWAYGVAMLLYPAIKRAKPVGHISVTRTMAQIADGSRLILGVQDTRDPGRYQSIYTVARDDACKRVHVELGVGNFMEVKDMVIDAVFRIARSVKATTVSMDGRPGFKRVLRPYGFTETAGTWCGLIAPVPPEAAAPENVH